MGCLGFRLPTEAEWELAARGGTSAGFVTGDPLPNDDLVGACRHGIPLENGYVIDDYARFCADDGPGPAPVGQRLPNGLGLFDIVGNVWEWVYDVPNPDRALVDPINGLKWGWEEETARVVKGGGWTSVPSRLQPSACLSYRPELRMDVVGFRLARTVP